MKQTTSSLSDRFSCRRNRTNVLLGGVRLLGWLALILVATQVWIWLVPGELGFWIGFGVIMLWVAVAVTVRRLSV
jgi:hypothetical protein